MRLWSGRWTGVAAEALGRYLAAVPAWAHMRDPASAARDAHLLLASLMGRANRTAFDRSTPHGVNACGPAVPWYLVFHELYGQCLAALEGDDPALSLVLPAEEAGETRRPTPARSWTGERPAGPGERAAGVRGGAPRWHTSERPPFPKPEGARARDVVIRSVHVQIRVSVRARSASSNGFG